jgi:NADH-quinone oxidoreductase subunit H
MKLILAYELPFIIAVFTVVAKSGSIIVGNIIAFQRVNGMLLLTPSCAIAALVVLIVAQAKLALVPFDAPEAEQELAGGALVEYSGVLLAIFKLTKAILLAALPVFLITLFLGGIDISSTLGISYFVLKYVLILLLITVIRNTNPRLRIDQAVKFFWGPVTMLAILGFILAMFGV